ncbi:RNA polymerase sigma factor [Ruminococcus sp.]|uniref:RNA polymerase sigma factor n=1 Tax=Ruminococcus sp. TaxID=41978 RepID=UPI0025F2AF53|nr:RNA polymerase sigma factor [Ruminococcus sp.]MBQ8966059.1 RNA polymerase sigma factor [Ruminococcus sp.]
MEDISVKYREYLDEHSDMVTRLCLIHTGSLTDAEDCYQNVFFKLYKAMKKGEIPNPKAWLIKVTLNECRSIFRYKLRRPTLSLDDISDLPAAPADSELMQLVMELPPKYRDVIYLYYYEEMTAEEIAEVSGTKAATVRSQLMRGREKLRGMLQG